MTDSNETRVVAKTGEGLRTEVEADGHKLVAIRGRRGTGPQTTFTKNLVAWASF